MKFEFRQYQKDVAEAWYADIKAGNCSPIIAVPTGAGKSIILGLVLKMYLTDFPSNKITVLTHTARIVKQDVATLKEFFPNKTIGIYSAGLNKKEIEQITVGSIQSVNNAKEAFRWTNLFIVDEVHSVNHRRSGNYRKLFEECRGVVAGMSATIFRTGHGYIYKGKGSFFDKLSYDLTSVKEFNKLVTAGYLTTLISVAPKTQLNSSKVKKSAGDYNIKDLAKAHDRETVTKSAISDALYYGKNYKKWLGFAIDIEHAEHISAELNKQGIKSTVLHSRITANRDKVIEEFLESDTRALVSVGMVTTGFDAPFIDLILLLRPTASAVLHVQMVGRGLRVFPGKKHCLILDYAGNTARLGPINNVIIPKSKEAGNKGKAPTKACPKCSTITYTVAKECASCGHEFVFEVKIDEQASTAPILEGKYAPPETKEKWLNVTAVKYSIHKKVGAPDSILVIYFCGLTRIKEWWCLDHSGYAGRKAKHQVLYRGYKGNPSTYKVFQNKDTLRKPKRIYVDLAPRYPVILNTQF